jgi:REP element-mobilizing transposase RayT
MAHSFTDLLTHIVFSTRHRQPLLTPDLQPRLFAYMGGIVRELDSVAVLINGPADHVHILAAIAPKTATADFLRELKSRSSGWVHETFPAHRLFAWQTGYAAFSVSESLRERVRDYIANQVQHHQRVTFQQEHIGLLEKHGIAYDPRFVLDE